MEQYNIRVTNTTKAVLTIIITPLLLVPLIVLPAIYGPKVPDWAVLVASFIFMAICIVVTLAVVRKVSPKAVMTIHEDGFSVDFTEKSIFSIASFRVRTNQVTNFCTEGTDDNYYMSFATSVKPSAFNISALSRKDADQVSFARLSGVIAAMVESNNELALPDAPPIATVSMYEKWWAKLIAGFAVIVVLVVLSLKIFLPEEKSPPWWKLCAMVALAFPFLLKVYASTFRKSKLEKSR